MVLYIHQILHWNSIFRPVSNYSYLPEVLSQCFRVSRCYYTLPHHTLCTSVFTELLIYCSSFVTYKKWRSQIRLAYVPNHVWPKAKQEAPEFSVILLSVLFSFDWSLPTMSALNKQECQVDLWSKVEFFFHSKTPPCCVSFPFNMTVKATPKCIILHVSYSKSYNKPYSKPFFFPACSFWCFSGFMFVRKQVSEWHKHKSSNLKELWVR